MQHTELRKISHAVFSIHLHIVFVTKYRRKVLTQEMLDDLKEIFRRVLEKNNSYLIECNLEPGQLRCAFGSMFIY